MAKKADTPSQATPAARKAAKSHLVAVAKDGQTINISPLTVDNHLQLGWKLVDAAAVPSVEEPAEGADSVSAETPAEDPDGGE